MLTPTRARTAVLYLPMIAATLLGACSGEVLAPSAAPAANEATSMFVPSAAAKAMIGVVDGTRSVTFDPSKSQSIPLGPNRIDIPADAVCALATSGYGAGTWNNACSPEKQLVTLTITIKGSNSQHPSLSFSPAMRFNPTRNVQLFMYAPSVKKDDAKNWWMFYCPDHGKCIDESLTDNSLDTFIDHRDKMLFRRVKHFSGYTVAERADEILGAAGL